MTITIYTTPNCRQCDFTIKLFEQAGIRYELTDVTTDAAALATVQALGYIAAPVVVAGAQHWSGFQPDRIAAVLVDTDQ